MNSSECFDFELLGQATFGRRVDYHATIGSTNDRAKQLAAEPACPTPLLVLAGRQTAGRGRGQNRWWSSAGSLTFSLLVGPETLADDPRRLPLSSLAVAVAVVDALATRLGPSRLGLHWPNDVLADGRKIAGILIEIAAGRRPVIGIGLNSNNSLQGAPDDVRRRATSLRELSGREQDQTELLLDLLVALEGRFSELRESYQRVCQAADRLCLDRGHRVTVEQGSAHITGRCEGIGDEGGLVIHTASGPRNVMTGHCRRL